MFTMTLLPDKAFCVMHSHIHDSNISLLLQSQMSVIHNSVTSLRLFLQNNGRPARQTCSKRHTLTNIQ